MSLIESALVGLLTADATVAATVGSRVYPLVAPASASLPLLVYQRISGPRVETHDGPSGLAHPRFQIACVAASYATAKQLAQDVRSALDGYSGTASGVTIDAILWQNEIDSFNEAGDESANSFGVLVDFVVWHHE